jgi:protoporphyrinogen oxidase
MKHAPDVVILGAGMAGFGAAHRLSHDGVVPRMYDQRPTPGGHATSYRFDDGFVFDDGPHISFSDDERFRGLLERSVDGRFERVAAYVNNYWQGHWIKHPAHANLHGLPTDLVVRCITELVDLASRPAPQVRNYQEWLEASYGPTFANTFPGTYTKKYHTTPAENLTTDWMGPRLYRGDLEVVLRGALDPETPDLHYIDKFRYPTHGGFVSYLDMFLPMAHQHYDHRVVEIDADERTIRFADGTTTGYEHLVSSIPLPKLIPLIVQAPAEVKAHAARLAATSAVIVNLGLPREDISPAHWTYFYDLDVSFSRLSFPHMLSPHTVPPGHGAIQAEVYYSEKYRPFDVTPDDVIEVVIADLVRCGLLREGEPIVHRSAWHTSGNVIFDHDRPVSLPVVHGFLDEIGVKYCGRYGDWGYLWTDDSFISGERAAEALLG